MNKFILSSVIIIQILIISLRELIADEVIYNRYVDSLLHELPKAKNDSVKIYLFHELGWELKQFDRVKAIFYSDSGIFYARKIKKITNEASFLNLKGIIYHENAELNKAIDTLNKALKLNESANYLAGLRHNYTNLGSVYFSLSDYQKAIDLFIKAQRINEKLKMEDDNAPIYINIALVFIEMGKLDKAYQYAEKSYNIFKKLNDEFSIGNSYLIMGRIFYRKKDLNKSLQFYQKAHEIFKKYNYSGELGNININIANIYYAQRNFTEALRIYKKVIDDKIKSNDFKNLAIAYSNMSLSFYYLYDSLNTKRNISKISYIDSSVYYAKKAEEIQLRINVPADLLTTYESLYQSYNLKGDFKNAYEYIQKYYDLNESIFSEENKSRINQIIAERDNELKDKEIELQRVKLIRSTNEKVALIVGLILLIVIIILIYINISKTKKLMYKILPPEISKKLLKKEFPIADNFDSATVIFTDIVGFTEISSIVKASEVVIILDKIYSQIDEIAKKYSIEKIKTIGDCYMAVSGIPVPNINHALNAVNYAVEVMKAVNNLKFNDINIQIRTGIDCGQVVAGVIGKDKFIYDLWGDTVNTASRMEESSEAGRIQVSERFREKVEEIPHNPPFSKGESPAGEINPISTIQSIEFPSLEKGGQGGFLFVERGEIEIKGKGMMKTYWLDYNKNS